MTDRYTAEGNRVFCDGRYFCFAVTDRAASLAADALNRCEAIDAAVTGTLRNMIGNPNVVIDPKKHHHDCNCISCCPPYEDAGAIDEATGCPNAYRVEGDERVCTRPGCGVRWSHDEDRPPCR